MTPDADDALIANLADCINGFTEAAELLLDQRDCLIQTLAEVDPQAAMQWEPLIDPLSKRRKDNVE